MPSKFNANFTNEIVDEKHHTTLFRRSRQPWQHARLTQNYDQSRFGHLWHDGTSQHSGGASPSDTHI